MICTYCENEFIPDKFNVCDNCMKTIVSPLKKRGRGKKSNPFNEYKKKVWKLTEINCKNLDGIENRGWRKDHIDHKYSIWQGFKDGKKAEEIASLENLRMLNFRENMLKGICCE